MSDSRMHSGADELGGSAELVSSMVDSDVHASTSMTDSEQHNVVSSVHDSAHYHDQDSEFESGLLRQLASGLRSDEKHYFNSYCTSSC